MAIKWRPAVQTENCAVNSNRLKASRMWGGRLLVACLGTLVLLAAMTASRPAQAQANFDRPGGDYQSAPVPSGDPADCALVCERDRRCRAWSFNYPTDISQWRGLLAEEQRAGAHRRMTAASPACAAPAWSSRAMARSKPRSTARAAITAALSSSAASATRPARQPAPPTTNAAPGPMRAPGYVGREAHCFLKKEIKPPRRKPGFTSGVVR